MTRGYSLENDLRLLINNPKYSDIEILCEDEKKLYACRAILTARSEVFDGLLYNGMKESYENQISFPKINSAVMEIILEYTYAGSIKEGTLTKDNTVEVFYAADYFQLSDLQDFIIRKTVKNTNFAKNNSPELLSKISEQMPLTEDNNFLNLLVKAVAVKPLNDIEFGRLSIAGLQCLLSCTYEKEALFATPEYEVFRYSAILAAKQVSNDAHNLLMRQLPTLEKLENTNSIKVENKFTDHQKVAKELEPLVKFIDFKRINPQILADIIEPLEIIPDKIISNVYRNMVLSSNLNLNNTRGIPFNEINYVWDEKACGSNLIIEENGNVVHAPSNRSNESSWKSVRAKMILENNGIYEWDVIIEKSCKNAAVGVCASENFDYEIWAGWQQSGWILDCRSGTCGNTDRYTNKYCPSSGDCAIITVHLDMIKRTCAFSVNGTKCPEVSAWNNLPSKLYPVVSLQYPGRFRIQSHQEK